VQAATEALGTGAQAASKGFAVKRHKPKSTVRDKMDPAAKADYEKMAEACIAAVIARQDNVFLSFPYFVKFKSRGFPKGMRVDRLDELRDLYKFNAQRLLNWLYEQGHSKHSYTDIMEASRAHNLRVSTMERSMDVDIPSYLCDNLDSQIYPTEKEK
jgi:hypothetical protein